MSANGNRKLLMLCACVGVCVLLGSVVQASKPWVQAKEFQSWERKSAQRILKYHQFMRFKRNAHEIDAFHGEEAYNDDENAEVIPEMNATEQERLEERIRQHAEQIAESFTKMWQSMVESVNHGLAAIRGIFSDSNDGALLKNTMDNEILIGNDGYRRN